MEFFLRRCSAVVILFLIVSSLDANAKAKKHAKAAEVPPNPNPTESQVKVLFDICERDLSSRIKSLELKEEVRFSNVRFDLGSTQATISEMPDMRGEGRRRRRKKAPPLPIGPAKMGYNLVMMGTAEEKAGTRKVTGRCLVYKGKPVTVTYELDALGTASTATTTTAPTATTATTLPAETPAAMALSAPSANSTSSSASAPVGTTLAPTEAPTTTQPLAPTTTSP